VARTCVTAIGVGLVLIALTACGATGQAATTPSGLQDFGAVLTNFEAANPKVPLPGTVNNRVDEYNLLTAPQSSAAATALATANLPADAVLESEKQLRSCLRLFFHSPILARTVPGLKDVMVQLSNAGGGRFNPEAIDEILFLPATQASPSC
jgi:hypothetical protein